jgi:hypothetical protein
MLPSAFAICARPRPDPRSLECSFRKERSARLFTPMAGPFPRDLGHPTRTQHRFRLTILPSPRLTSTSRHVARPRSAPLSLLHSSLVTLRTLFFHGPTTYFIACTRAYYWLISTLHTRVQSTRAAECLFDRIRQRPRRAGRARCLTRPENKQRTRCASIT